MNRMKSPLGAVAVAMLLCLGCASGTYTQGKAGPVPGWMIDLDKTYPDSRFMAAIGSGDTRRDAEADAAGALARRFKVDVKVDSQAMQRYSDLVSKNQDYSETERSVVQKVTSSASEQFINLTYGDPYTDAKGKVNIVAYLDREKTAVLYKGIVAKDAALIGNLRERAANAAGKLAAFALVDSALLVSRNSDRMVAQLQLINAAAAREAAGLLDSAGLAKQRDELVRALGYRLAIAGDGDGVVAAMVKKTLAGFNLAARDDGQLTVQGTVSIEPEPNPKYKTLRWSLALSLVDETGTSIADFLRESKENGISDSAARGFVLREMEKRVQNDFSQAINDYLARVATGK